MLHKPVLLNWLINWDTGRANEAHTLARLMAHFLSRYIAFRYILPASPWSFPASHSLPPLTAAWCVWRGSCRSWWICSGLNVVIFLHPLPHIRRPHLLSIWIPVVSGGSVQLGPSITAPVRGPTGCPLFINFVVNTRCLSETSGLGYQPTTRGGLSCHHPVFPGPQLLYSE